MVVFNRSIISRHTKEREQMEDEITELRQRNERRKKEREVEEKRLAAERAAEDERRKTVEESKKRQKMEDEEKRQRERAKKKAEFDKWKNPPKPNFVISKRSGSAGDEEEEEKVEEEEGDGGKGRKSREQLEVEKRAILKQRVKPLDVDDFDSGKLTEKAKELHALIYRLEGEKYDLEKRFKAQQIDMMELAERARQANKVGKGGLKRLQPGHDDTVDKIQERFAGAPAKIEMYSKYERQKDKRSYDERLQIYTGPQYLYPAERIKPKKIIRWTEDGMPMYDELTDSGPTNGPINED